jgi:hypothetical protein
MGGGKGGLDLQAQGTVGFSTPARCECSAGIPSRRTVSRSKSNSIITAVSSPTNQSRVRVQSRSPE